MSGHNGFFGLKDFRIASVVSEAPLTYGAVVNVASLGGIMELQMNAQTSTNTTYANDIPWIDSETDNGFEGTARLVNIWGNPTLRAIFAPLCGYEFASDGTLLGSSTKERQKFAILSEPSGNISNKRICWLLCQFKKPNKSAQSKGENGNHVADEFPITARPVTLSTGWTGSFYENIPSDGSAYTNFYSAVRTNLSPNSGVANANLASLSVGTLTLNPLFDAESTTYTVATTNATDAVSATAEDNSATVAIAVNGDAHTSGSSAEWSTGTNIVSIVVTNGSSIKAYTVVVTKGSGE